MDEIHLIHQVKSGNTESFRFLYRLHAQAAWQFAMSICKDKLKAQEAVQTGFINAFKYIQTFKGESSFKTWLLRIVFNESIRIIKNEKLFRWEEINGNESEQESIQLTTSSGIETKELKEQVSKTLALLSEKESVVLNLFYLEEQSIKEVANILGYTESNVKVLLHRARKKFKLNYEKL